MTVLTHFPWAMNQDIPEGYGYSAEALRAQHYAATSGGTGVDTPTALQVQAQPAPDGTVNVVPGGATAASTYLGQDNQSYHVFYGDPQTVDIPPTGSSSGGRHDLVVQRFIDPDHEQIPGYEGTYPIPAETAKDMRFSWIEVLQGRSSTSDLPYPHAKLAHIRRGPNRTTVESSDIVDLRKLANPQKDWHMEGRNLDIAETESLHSGSTVWPTPATHMMEIPDFATRMKISAGVEMAKSHSTAGTAGHAAGNFLVYFIHPDGTEINTQQTTWRTSGQQNREDLTIQLTHTLAVPTKFRGQTVRVEFRARKTTGPNVYADGSTSFRLVVFFEQEIA